MLYPVMSTTLWERAAHANSLSCIPTHPSTHTLGTAR